MHLTYDEMEDFTFRFFQKTALLQARLLTKDDYQQSGGTIQTREGTIEFQPGDYLARGIENEEWSITKDHFSASYERVSEPDSEGFAFYRALDICQAYQITEPFTVRRLRGDILTGKACDYLVRSGTRVWIVDRTIFENSYKLLSEC